MGGRRRALAQRFFDQAIEALETTTGERVRRGHDAASDCGSRGKSPKCVRWSSDGRFVTVAGHVLDIVRGRERFFEPQPAGPFEEILYDPATGERAVSGPPPAPGQTVAFDRTNKLWSPANWPRTCVCTYLRSPTCGRWRPC